MSTDDPRGRRLPFAVATVRFAVPTFGVVDGDRSSETLENRRERGDR